MTKKEARATAARIIALVIHEGKTLDRCFSETVPIAVDAREQALIKELCFGVLRWYYRLDYLLDRLLDKPIRRKDTDIRAIILSGLYQLAFMRIPAHAAVSASVDAAGQLNKPWAKQLINAVLRRYQRESSVLEESMRKSEMALYAHPEWLLTTIKGEWPSYWQQILAANNLRPPMHLRVNLQKVRRDAYLGKLSAAGITAQPAASPACGITLSEPAEVAMLPGFDQGLVSVQDLGAQQAAGMLDLKPGQRVLDACAAPGGKTGHILETEPALASVTAVDQDANRLQRLRENCQRLGFTVTVAHADSTAPDTWWSGVQFDRILLDVPCSATGVIRRHPDIKVLRQQEAIPDYCDQQDKLLAAAWPMLARPGRLVYATCSILRAENDQRITYFLQKYPDARNIGNISSWGIKTDHGVQLLPGIGEADGFFYAVLEKQ